MSQGEHPKHPGVRDAALLGTVERYFVEIMPIPRLAARIHCFALTRTFGPTIQRVRSPLSTLGFPAYKKRTPVGVHGLL